MKIIIIDTKSGNIASLKNALDHLGLSSKISNNEKDLDASSHLILPGVGSYINFMESLNSLKIIDNLKENILNRKKPFLGICVGMQVLSSFGLENDKCKGLGLIDGEVKIIPTKNKIPHIGWNSIEIEYEDEILKGINNLSYFYFVHSYCFFLDNQKNLLSKTSYGFEIPSIIKKDNIYGVQFHPEKSQKKGLKLLENFSNLK